MKPRIRHRKIDSRKSPELRVLAQRIGQFIEYWGFKAVHGRMWCYLYLSPQPLSSRELAQWLEISPALVTQSVQVLLRYRVIIDAEKGPNGALRYEANPQVAEAIATVLRQRESVLLSQIAAAQATLQKANSPELHRVRVKQVGSWVSLANELLSAGIHSLDGPTNSFLE